MGGGQHYDVHVERDRTKNTNYSSRLLTEGAKGEQKSSWRGGTVLAVVESHRRGGAIHHQAYTARQSEKGVKQVNNCSLVLGRTRFKICVCVCVLVAHK